MNPYTSKAGTSPFVLIVSLIGFIAILRIIQSGKCMCSFFTTLIILLSGQWNISPFPIELCTSTPLNWSLTHTSFAFSLNSADSRDDSLSNIIASGKPVHNEAQKSMKSFHKLLLDFTCIKMHFDN